MKILFVIRSLECGGAERQLVLLANELGRRGHSVWVAVLRSGGPREADLDQSRVQLLHLESSSRFHRVGSLARLGLFMRRERPDVVHGYLSAGNLIALAGWAWTPRAALVFGIRDSNMDKARYGRVTRFTSAVASRLSFAADGIIANSEAGRTYAIQSGSRAKKLFHVPNAIDTAEFYPDEGARQRVRAEWKIQPGESVVGLVGRIDPMKGHETFLRAAALVSRGQECVRFVCVGSGRAGFTGNLHELASSLGIENRVLWLADRKDMRAVYNAFDVFCLASIYGEGFPNVLGEAMACSRRCVATDVGDARFVAGSAAVIVPPNDADALAAALQEQLSGRRFSPEARERIVSLFSVDQLAGRTEIVLNQVRKYGGRESSLAAAAGEVRNL
jgi:glycosyltransferase involved in cell wall biosynthesis